MKRTIETEKERLIQVKNEIRLLIKEKKAIEHFIEDENNRLIGINSIKDKVYHLREDPEFIKKNHRKRYYWEIGNIVGYSEKSIKRIFSEDKDIEKNLSNR
jgi:hypothetical protein